MARARIRWDVDRSEIDKFQNILAKIKIILEQLDKDIVDSLDIPVLQNINEQYLKRMSVKTIYDKKDGHSIAKYFVDTKDFEDALRLLEKIYLIVEENNLSSEDFKNIDIINLAYKDHQFFKNR